MLLYQYSWNSKVETTWISLICWHHKTSITYHDTYILSSFNEIFHRFLRVRQQMMRFVNFLSGLVASLLTTEPKKQKLSPFQCITVHYSRVKKSSNGSIIKLLMKNIFALTGLTILLSALVSVCDSGLAGLIILLICYHHLTRFLTNFRAHQQF